MKTLLVCLLAVGLVWLSGVRMHSEVLKDYGEIFFQRDYRLVEMRGGTKVIGEFVSETPRGVQLKTRDGVILFPSTSIVKTKQLVIHEVFEALRDGELPGSPAKSFLAYLPGENHVFPLIQKIQEMLPA